MTVSVERKARYADCLAGSKSFSESYDLDLQLGSHCPVRDWPV